MNHGFTLYSCSTAKHSPRGMALTLKVPFAERRKHRAEVGCKKKKKGTNRPFNTNVTGFWSTVKSYRTCPDILWRRVQSRKKNTKNQYYYPSLLSDHLGGDTFRSPSTDGRARPHHHHHHEHNALPFHFENERLFKKMLFFFLFPLEKGDLGLMRFFALRSNRSSGAIHHRTFPGKTNYGPPLAHKHDRSIGERPARNATCIRSFLIILLSFHLCQVNGVCVCVWWHFSENISYLKAKNLCWCYDVYCTIDNPI